MPVDISSFFAQVIQDHLQLKQRNATLEETMPIARYRADDPFGNHPLFKTEEQARLEETLGGEVSIAESAPALAWPGEDVEVRTADESGLWTRSRDFDWGD